MVVEATCCYRACSFASPHSRFVCRFSGSATAHVVAHGEFVDRLLGREDRNMSITDTHSKKEDKDKLPCNRVYRRDDVSY